ncbi:MAG: cytochrome P450 [Microcoleus sp.]|uniref:cytochrome P450 n=1 Tax=Microcoleus sp. CAWBG640 TaxID=2841653 RepID=UPI00312B9F60
MNLIEAIIAVPRYPQARGSRHSLGLILTIILSGLCTVINACEFGGYEIPKGWSVLYEINQTHQDATVYPEPDRFNPDRFNSERSAKPFTYVPFGGGLRECLGKEFARLEMKLFAARMIRECDWELLPDQDLNLIRVPTPHPRDGLRVKFQRIIIKK